MVFEYYPDTDMLTIKLGEGLSAESEEISPGVVLDYDANNCVNGVEIEDASKFMDLTHLELKAFPLTNLILSKAAVA